MRINYLANLLEHCQFKKFWSEKAQDANLISQISGFDDAIRKFVCHVVNITYQSVDKAVLKEILGNITGTLLYLFGKQWAKTAIIGVHILTIELFEMLFRR